MQYEAVIGLEVHVQLQTESKIFSPSSTKFGAEENSQVDPVCLGMPGVLPVLNKKAVEYAIRMGLATHCQIAEKSIFARKHYFYPDLPKGYQISQYENPLCENGYLEIESDDPVVKDKTVTPTSHCEWYMALRAILSSRTPTRHCEESSTKQSLARDWGTASSKTPRSDTLGCSWDESSTKQSPDGKSDLERYSKTKRISIVRIHLEEDAGKSVHKEEYVSENETLIDLNRCGVPLIEIVSGPDIRTPKEAVRYLEKMRQLVRYLEISDGNMAEGSLRCDANISIRPVGTDELGTKTELKNMNSISGVEKALAFEIKRQIETLQNGGVIHQQTLLWDADRNVAIMMRSKEHAHDYRYFPDPDLVPVIVDEKWREQVKSQLPELPWIRRNRFVEQYGLPAYDADVLTTEREVADYFEAVTKDGKHAKTASNWVMGEVMRVLNENKQSISEFAIQPQRLAELIALVENGTISGNIARKVFDEMLESDKSPGAIIDEKGLMQISDTGKLESLVDDILASHPAEAERYRNGEQKLIGFFVGQLMRATKGKANPKVLNALLRDRLGGIS